jgi:hypothetical protein
MRRHGVNTISTESTAGPSLRRRSISLASPLYKLRGSVGLTKKCGESASPGVVTEKAEKSADRQFADRCGRLSLEGTRGVQ